MRMTRQTGIVQRRESQVIREQHNCVGGGVRRLEFGERCLHHGAESEREPEAAAEVFRLAPERARDSIRPGGFAKETAVNADGLAGNEGGRFAG
jgi:hypothetical protein